jgi:hypothetical protein
MLLMVSSADDREKRLKGLTQTIGNSNRRDTMGMMNQLSQEFDRHIRLAEGCVGKNDSGGAECHRLIAESIHVTLKTFEVKQRNL